MTNHNAREAQTKTYFDYWKRQLGLEEELQNVATVSYGSFVESGIQTDDDEDAFGCTLSSPNGDEYIIAINDTCPDAKLSETILHELLHVVHGLNGDEGEETLVRIATSALYSLFGRKIS